MIVDDILQVASVQKFLSEVENELIQQEQVDVPLSHYFSKDVYAREMNPKKGTLLVGKIHKYANLNILSQGEVSILSIDGCMRVKAPYTFVGSPGAKRLFYVHEDAVWTVIHGTPEKDIEKIEDYFIAKNYKEIDEGLECLG